MTVFAVGDYSKSVNRMAPSSWPELPAIAQCTNILCCATSWKPTPAAPSNKNGISLTISIISTTLSESVDWC